MEKHPSGWFGRLLLSCVALLALVVVVSCGGDNSNERSDEGATVAPAELKDLVVGIPADTTVVEGDRANIGQGSPNANIVETLLIMTPDYEVRPHLAERWELVGENTFRFTLRKGVKFHDGTELTSADVVWTFDRVARAGGRAINAALGSTVAIDDYTVEYTPSVPNLKIPLQVVHPIFGIHKAGSDPTKAPIGTGPFKFVSYTPKESLKVERFADYWDTAKAPKVRSITFRYIPDNNARVLALDAGDVDIITEVPRESVSQIENRHNIAKSRVGAYVALSITIHGEGEWSTTSEKAVREAIFKGLDRKTIVDKVWEGNAEVGKNLIPPSILGPFQSIVTGGPTYDPAGAKKVLDDAGWKVGSDGIRERDGKKLQLTLISGFPDAASHRPIPEVIQQQLKEIGIGIRIQEVTDYDAQLEKGEGHLWLERGNQNDANPAFLPTLLYLSLEAGNRAGEDYARLFGVGAKVDAPLLEAAKTADIPKTQELAAKAMKVLIDEEMVIVPIAGVYNITAATKNISGWQPHSALVHTSFASVVKK